MFMIIGMVVVTGSVIGGYMAMGGKLGVLFQPFELVIIGGSGVGAFIIANSLDVIKRSIGGVVAILKGAKYKKPDYLELLTLQYQVFRLAKSKGMLALEPHVENPHESMLFQQFPKFISDHHATEFLCDYLRLMTLGTDNPMEVETLMDQELDVHHQADHAVVHAINSLSESFPGLGIVAAVLGIIKTMKAITEPPEILGGLIGAALVGTFAGILLSYGFVSPMGKSLENTFAADAHYMGCIKIALIGHMQGYAPQVSVEFARKSLASDVRPTFAEVEDMLTNLPSG